MTLSPALLEILVCPETHQPLRIASESELTQLNSAVAQQSLRSTHGVIISDRFDAALIREDGLVCYAVRKGIPILLADQAVAMPSRTVS